MRVSLFVVGLVVLCITCCYLVDCTSTIDCLERLVSEMTTCCSILYNKLFESRVAFITINMPITNVMRIYIGNNKLNVFQ